MLSNVSVYLSIAEESLSEAQRLEELARRPKPNGEPGFIITYDPQRRSFKNSLIAIAFAAMYLEAMFYITGVNELGIAIYKKHDNKSYEDKLKLFGLSDVEMLKRCEQFRLIRNALVHEKAVQPNEMTAGVIYVAQNEAKNAVALVKEIATRLRERKLLRET